MLDIPGEKCIDDVAMNYPKYHIRLLIEVHICRYISHLFHCISYRKRNGIESDLDKTIDLSGIDVIECDVVSISSDDRHVENGIFGIDG